MTGFLKLFNHNLIVKLLWCNGKAIYFGSRGPGFESHMIPYLFLNFRISILFGDSQQISSIGLKVQVEGA